MQSLKMQGIIVSILYTNFLRKGKEWDLWFLDVHFLKQSPLPVLFEAENVRVIFTAMNPTPPFRDRNAYASRTTWRNLKKFLLHRFSRIWEDNSGDKCDWVIQVHQALLSSTSAPLGKLRG